jgi:dTMP kinase
MKPGFFMTLEGIDGCGKSTQARLLAEFLSNAGYEAILTREPGGTPLAEEIRNVILTPGDEPLDPMSEILLYTASRAQHVNNLIKPALAKGNMVICERFIDSSLAYQGYGLGRDLALIREINHIAIGNFKPDLTFLLDVNMDLSLRRVKNRSNLSHTKIDRIESRDIVFQQQVLNGFRELAQQESRIVLIDAVNKSINEIHTLIKKYLAARLGI